MTLDMLRAKATASGEELYAEIRREVKEAQEERRLEEAATAWPRPMNVLRSQFPLSDVWAGSLKTKSVEMRIGNLAYRFVVDKFSDRFSDEEGTVTFELWRENEKVHRHLQTIGELHMMYLPFRDEVIETCVISVLGEEMERYKYPTVLEAGGNRRAFTASEYALNLVRVKHDATEDGIRISEMFLFYLVAAAELLGVMKLHEFVEFYSPNEVRNIIQTLEPGSWLTRPSLEQAGLRGLARAEAVSGVANNNGVKPEAEKEKPRKRKENPRDVFLGDTDETDSDEEFEVERKKTLRRALFNEGPGLANKIWARFNIAEKDQDPELQNVARKALMGEWNWNNFDEEDMPAAIRLARRIGITSNPPGMAQGVPQGIPFMPYKVGKEAAAAEARRQGLMGQKEKVEEKPVPVLTSTVSSASSLFVDDVSAMESTHNNAVLYPPLPEPVPAVVGDNKKPIQVVTISDDDVTMMTLSSSLLSPRAELSYNGTEERNDDLDELLSEDKEDSNESIQLGPFLSDPNASIKNVSTSEEESQDQVEVNESAEDGHGINNDSVQIVNPEEEVNNDDEDDE